MTRRPFGLPAFIVTSIRMCPVSSRSQGMASPISSLFKVRLPTSVQVPGFWLAAALGCPPHAPRPRPVRRATRRHRPTSPSRLWGRSRPAGIRRRHGAFDSPSCTVIRFVAFVRKRSGTCIPSSRTPIGSPRPCVPRNQQKPPRTPKPSTRPVRLVCRLLASAARLFPRICLSRRTSRQAFLGCSGCPDSRTQRWRHGTRH